MGQKLIDAADRPSGASAEALRLRILHVERDRSDADRVAAALAAEPGVVPEITRVDTPEGYSEALRSQRFDAILADCSTPGIDPITAVSRARAAWPETPYIVVTGADGEDRALQALRAGATDYVLKDRLRRLAPATRRAVAASREREQRRRAEEALRQSEERFRLAVSAFAGMVYDLDAGTGRVQRSEGVLDVIGVAPDRAEPTTEWWRDRVHPEDRAVLDSLLTVRGEAGDSRYSVEYRVRHESGHWVHVWDKGIVVRDASGSPIRAVGSATDITQRVLAEEALARHRDRLEDIVRDRTRELQESHQKLRLTERMASLGTLAAGLGHDMGNLLLPVRMRLDALAAEQLAPAAREDVGAIASCVEYLQRLTAGLRLFAADPDGPPDPAERTELGPWWTEVEPFLRNVLPRTVALTPRLDDALPPVRLARHKLTQAVFNLVQNAGDALRSAPGGRVTVWARAESAGSRVRIGVTDDGPGMSDEVRRRCLEPFYSTKIRGISTGLGLALVHGIVQQIGGHLEIETAPGAGTTVWLELPAASTAAPSAQVACVSVSDPRAREIVSALLGEYGYLVHRADGPGDDARLWVVESASGDPVRAAEFSRRPGRRLVVVGDAGGPWDAVPGARLAPGGPLSSVRAAVRAAALSDETMAT